MVKIINYYFENIKLIYLYIYIMIKDIFIAIVSFLVLDMFYLGMTKNYWNRQVKLIQGTDINIKKIPTFLSYFAIIFSWYYFIYLQHKHKRKLEYKIIVDAFIFGSLTYAVFEFTNYAIFDKWELASVIADTLWGGILYALVTVVVFFLKDKFN